MTSLDLPECALLLLFGDVASLTWNGLSPACLCQPEAVAAKLMARNLCVVDATHLSKDDLSRLGRMAADAFARVYGAALATDADLVARRLSSLSIVKTFAVPVPSNATFLLQPVSTDRRKERGPFDIIGDVHGCADELIALLGVLGYQVAVDGKGGDRKAIVIPPRGRRAFFVGDLVDRGPKTPDVLRIVMAMVASGSALCVTGNHDVACLRWMDGNVVHLKHGLEQTVADLKAEPESFRAQVHRFLASLTGHLWVDGGQLAVAHAGVLEPMIGRSSGRVRAFTLYGDTEPKSAPDGLPTRYHWALNYSGATAVVYGHTPVAEVGWVNNTLCVDTGCCFGGRLTALRWPEREIVSVPARDVYALRGRAFGHPPARPK